MISCVGARTAPVDVDDVDVSTDLVKSSGIVKSGIKKDSDETAKFELVGQNMFDCNDWGESWNIGVFIEIGFVVSTYETVTSLCTVKPDTFIDLDKTGGSEVVG